MAYSICIYCGHSKNNPLIKCGLCGKTPKRSDLDMARSIILSTSPDDDGEPFKTKEELLNISGQLSSGGSYAYKQETLDRLLKQKRLLDESPEIEWGFLLFGFCFLIIPIIALVTFFNSAE